MTTNAVEIQGTLREDGTLVLDKKPDLPPGRVKVMVQPANPTPDGDDDIIAVLERIHAAQRLRGYVPRSVGEIDAYLADSREDDERSQLIERIQDECRREREAKSAAEVE